MKSKLVIYNKFVPLAIRELMGEKPYKYIHGYNYQGWTNAFIDTVPELKSINSKADNVEYWPSALEDIIEYLESIRDNPDYINGTLEHEYEYDGYGSSSTLYVNYKYTPTQSEIDKYNEEMEQYNAELEVFKKLQALIKELTKGINVLKKQADDLKKQLKSIQKDLEKAQKAVASAGTNV